MPSNYLPPILSFFNETSHQNITSTSSWVGFNNNISLYINGKTPSSGNMDLFIGGMVPWASSLSLVLYNTNSDKIYPSGLSSYSGVWVNSDGGVNNMWSYVDEDPYNSFSDTTSITSYQSGYAVKPLNLYWTSESGIFKYNLQSSGITKILDGNVDTQLSYHIAYNNIDDFIYYGVEDGNTSYVKRIDTLGLRNTSISSNCGAGLAFSKYNNTLFSMSKDGDFKVVVNEQTTVDKTSLLGRETLIRRLRINQDTEEIYGLQTEATSYLTKVYKYNPSTGLWQYLRILTYGMFGGAFDIDYTSGNIYYTATSDYFTPSYYGIVKESLTSGSGTRIVNVNSPSYFQTRELAFNQSERYLYYVGEDISSANKIYNLKKCDDIGGSQSTLLSLPEHSGIQAMAFDGGIYKSYIDFDITDLSSTFAGYGATQANISSAFVSVKARNHNHYSHIRAKLFINDKTDYIWYPNYSASTPRIDSSGVTTGVVYDIGRNNSSINSSYNNSTTWNNGVLRIEVAASPSGNSDITTIDSVNMVLTSNVSVGISVNDSIPLYTKAHISESNSIPLHTVSDANVGSIDLYTIAAIWSSGEIPTYIYGKDSVNNNATLYIYGSLPSSEIGMYLYGHALASGDFTMYASGLGVEYGAIPLYLHVKNTVQSSGNVTLFTWSSESSGLYKAIDLFTTTIPLVNPSGILSLYTHGYGGTPRSSSMNLFLKSETPSVANTVDLMVGNYYSSATNSTYLTLMGPSGSLGAEYSSGTMSLVLGTGNSPVSNTITLFVNTQEQKYNYIPLILEGQPNIRNYTTLYVSGVQPVFNSIKLYI